MRRWILLALGVLTSLAGLILSEKRKVEAPVSPASFLYFIADTERELTRLPVSFTRLSDEDEIRMGNELARRYEGFRARGEAAPADRAVAGEVAQVGSRVAAHAHRKLPYQFHYIADPSFINAFALPGGHVFIGGGLIALMDSEDELAAVLGHEIEHIDHYHCAERLQVESALRKIPLGQLVALPVEVFEAGYTKDQELEADREGTRLAVWASYSPLGAIRMFEAFDRLYQEHVTRARTPQEELSRAALDTLLGYFRSHPPMSERIAQIRKMIAEEHWGNLMQERKLEVAYLFWSDRARRALEAKHYPEAAAAAARSLVLRPDQPEALRVLGEARFYTADFVSAAQAYRRVLELNPSDEGAGWRYAETLAAQGDYSAGAREFQGWLESLKSPPDHVDSFRAHLAGLRLLAGDESQAQSILDQGRKSASGGPAPEVQGALGFWYYRAGRSDRAVELLGNALEQRPGNRAYQLQLGWSLIELGKLQSAIQSLSARAGTDGAMGVAVANWLAGEREAALANFQLGSGTQPYWLNPRWVRALYRPTVARCVNEMQAEHQRRLAAERRRY